MFSIIYSQSSDYESKVKETKIYIESIYKSDSSKIKSYVKNSQNGKIYSLKSLDVYEEYGYMVYDNIYQILEKDNSIVFVKKLPYYWAEGMAFNESFYEYYFDESKRLIGAKKSAHTSYYEDPKNVSYNIEYTLNKITDKLERTNEYYADINQRKLDSQSKIIKLADKDGLTKNSVKLMDKITFSDLEGFMKTEKIKYYRTDKKERELVFSAPKNNIGKGNNDDPLGGNDNGDSKIGIGRKLVNYIPGTMGRGGTPPAHNCSVKGAININYTVDKFGRVTYAHRISGISDACVVSTSISWVKKYVKAEESTTSSSGTYTIKF